MNNRPTPETDALAENLIPIVEKITEFNAQYVIKQILTEILTKTTKIERERDEANEELHKQLVQYDQFFDESDKIRIERDELRDAIVGLENKWKYAVEIAARAEIERDDALAELDNMQNQRDEARMVLERIVKLSIHARCVEEDYAEWEKAVLAILDLCEEAMDVVKILCDENE